MNATEAYVELLAEEGYRPTVSESNPAEIRFKVEGDRFRAYVDPKDDGFFALVLAYRTPEGVPSERLLHEANRVNDDYKVVKACVADDASTVRFSFEVFTPGTLAADLLTRAISALRYASDRYFEHVREAEPEAKA